MNINGWIKLHRKLLGNEIVKDTKAFTVFVVLALMADDSGIVSIGRFQGARYLQSSGTG